MNTTDEEIIIINNKTTVKQYCKAIPWIMCALAAVFYSYEYFLRIMPSVLETQLRQYFNYTDAATFAGVTAFYYYIYTPMQLPVGVLMDRFGPRRLLTLACLACAIGAYVFVAKPSLGLASFGRFLVGLGSAFAYVGVLKLATIWFAEDKFAFFAGTAAALGATGAMAGEMMMVKLAHYVSWMQMFYISAIIGLVLSIILWCVIRDSTTGGSYEPRKSEGVGSFAIVLRDLVTIISKRQIWINGLFGCLIYLPTTIFAEKWGPSFLEYARGFTPEQAVFGVSSLFLGFIVGAPLLGTISDRIQKRRPIMLFGAIGATILSSIFLYVPTLSVTAIYTVLFGTGIMYGAQALVFAVGRDLSPRHATATAVAVTNMLVMLGGIFLQPTVGVILEWVWSGEIVSHLHVYSAWDYQVALSVMPIGTALAAFLTFFLRDTTGIRDSGEEG